MERTSVRLTKKPSGRSSLMDVWATISVLQARPPPGTRLPKNHACRLIAPAGPSEGDLRGGPAAGKKPVPKGSRFKKKMRDKKWRQTAHKICKTPSSTTFVKPKRH